MLRWVRIFVAVSRWRRWRRRWAPRTVFPGVPLPRDRSRSSLNCTSLQAYRHRYSIRPLSSSTLTKLNAVSAAEATRSSRRALTRTWLGRRHNADDRRHFLLVCGHLNPSPSSPSLNLPSPSPYKLNSISFFSDPNSGPRLLAGIRVRAWMGHGGGVVSGCMIIVYVRTETIMTGTL